MMRTLIWNLIKTLAIVIFLAGMASADSITIATFEDPTGGSGTPLFTLTNLDPDDPSGATLSGSWTGTGLKLLYSPTGASFSDVTFSFTTYATGDGDPIGGYFFGPGSFSFMKGPNVLLTYAWDEAILSDSGFGSNQVEGLKISVPGSSPLYGATFSDPQSMSFNFTNSTGVLSSGGTIKWTSAFTSSAAVPEPSLLILLGLGILGVAGHTLIASRGKDGHLPPT
jgi:hypothetical protein